MRFRCALWRLTSRGKPRRRSTSISIIEPSPCTDSPSLSGRFRLVSAVHLLLIRDAQVLLLRRAGTGYQDGNYSVVAGHLQGGEPVKAAAVREAREEVGIEVAPQDLQVVGVMHRLSDDERIDFFLRATAWSGSISNREPDRCDQLLWTDLDALPDNVIPYIRRALRNYRSGRWFDSYGWDAEGET